jgi:NAD(P)-dependent dehydrogenase (short-subunit alcohol dehydrogenase family)
MDPKDYRHPVDLLRDRTILITGASDGIGRALALEAARCGARVILHGRNVRKLEAVYDAIEAQSGNVRPSIAVMDFASANASGYETLAGSLADEFGRLDGLVHNAAILGERFAIEQYDAVMWQRVLHINLTAAFALTQVCMPLPTRQLSSPRVASVAPGAPSGVRTPCPSLVSRDCHRCSRTSIATASCG